MSINARLIQGLDADETERFSRDFETAKKGLKRIRALIIKEIEKSYIDEEQALPELAVIAKILGYRQGLREVLKFLPEE